jgi:hypothetical protein
MMSDVNTLKINEVIANDTYSTSEQTIEGYHCAQVIFGMA